MKKTETAVPMGRLGLLGISGLAALLAAPAARAAVAKRPFDFVVGVDGDWKAAVAAAAKKASASYRYRIFFPDGEYDVGALTGDANRKSTFATADVSFIGQSADKTVLFNKSINEGIGITATLYLHGADDLYMQDLTVMNRANYGQPSTYSATGRHVAIQEQADRMIYKNVHQLSTQDTYYTKGTRTYWEGGRIDGTTDFICGGGNVYFNRVELNEMKDGSPITASQPAAADTWGYVFESCTIGASKSGYLLGRSWGEGRVVFLRTTMKQIAADGGWGDPMNNVPKVFAEYKTVDANGKAVDLSRRRTTYTKDGTTVNLNPVLSDAEAAKYTLRNVLGGADDWRPDELARQVSAPAARQEGAALKWNDNDSASCWAIFRNGKYLANVAAASFDISALAKGDVLTVRAANAMGGLGPASNAVTVGSTVGIVSGAAPGVGPILSRRGSGLRIAPLPGPASLVIIALDGSLRRRIPIHGWKAGGVMDFAAPDLPEGLYTVRVEGKGLSGAALRIRLPE